MWIGKESRLIIDEQLRNAVPQNHIQASIGAKTHHGGFL
jgi:hypothetical protein